MLYAVTDVYTLILRLCEIPKQDIVKLKQNTKQDNKLWVCSTRSNVLWVEMRPPKIPRLRVFPGGTSDKEPACHYRSHEMQVWSLGQEDSLEEGMATHSGILAWRIPWTEEPGGLRSIGRVTKSQIQLKQLSTHTKGLSCFRSCKIYTLWVFKVYFLTSLILIFLFNPHKQDKINI